MHRSLHALGNNRFSDVAVQALDDPLTLLDTLEGGYILGVLLACVLPIVRALLDATVYKPIGRYFLPQHGKTVVSSRHAGQSTRLYKWKESFWKSTVYASLTLLAFRASYKEKFFYDTKHFWLGCSQFPPCNYEVPRLVRLLYSCELAYYLQALPYLMFFEVQRKDFWENVCHHFATLGLITYSYQVNFMKVGTMVFLCHDVNDVFMELAKMMGYIERKRLSTALFVWFMLTWFFSRMYYFPVYVIRSVWSEPIEVVAKVYHIDPHPHHEIFLTLLSILFALHVYWTVLIIKVAVTAIQGDISDVREEKVGPESDTIHKKQT